MTENTTSGERHLYGDPQHEERVRSDATGGAIYGDPQHEVGSVAASDFELAVYGGDYPGAFEFLGEPDLASRTPRPPTDGSAGVSSA